MEPKQAVDRAAASLDKVRQEYETKIAEMQTQFVRKQIAVEKEHAKEVSKCLQKLEGNQATARQRSLEIGKSLRTTGMRQYPNSSVMRNSRTGNREAVLRQAILVNQLMGDFERKLEKCGSDKLIPGLKIYAGKIKSTRKHRTVCIKLVHDSNVKYIDEVEETALEGTLPLE